RTVINGVARWVAAASTITATKKKYENRAAGVILNHASYMDAAQLAMFSEAAANFSRTIVSVECGRSATHHEKYCKAAPARRGSHSVHGNRISRRRLLIC